jgi:type I restriction enzyme, S subunit
MAVRPGYKQTEVGVIPEDWEVSPVGAKGEVRAGKALAVRGAGPQRPYLRTKNVFDGRIDLNDVLRMPMTDADFARYCLEHGDVLLNEGQSLELVGRCAMYKGEYPEPCAIQNQLVRFRARDGVSADFAAQLFRYCQKIGVFARIALQTTSVAHLGVSRFHRLQLAWPPEEVEQEAIAEALSDADALIESLEQLLARKRQLKQGAMQELLTGKKRLPGFEIRRQGKQSEVGVIPEDWEVESVGKRLRRAPSYGINAPAISFDSRFPTYLRITDITEDGRFSEVAKASVEHPAAGSYLLEPGDIVFARTGASVGKSYLYNPRDGCLVFAGFLIRLSPDPERPTRSSRA